MRKVHKNSLCSLKSRHEAQSVEEEIKHIDIGRIEIGNVDYFEEYIKNMFKNYCNKYK